MGGELLSSEALAAIPDFASIRKEIWEKFPGAISRKSFPAGSILMREGEHGATAFYLLSGSVEVYINNPISHVESRRQKTGGWLRVIIELNIPSYRVEHAKQKQQAENQAEGEGGGPV